MRAAIILIVVLMAPLSACGASEPAPSEGDIAPAVVVVGFDRDDTVPLIAEGLADRSTGRMVEANDPVRVASISKLVMALAALRLVDEGVVDLDTDVSTYLGWSVRAPGFPDTAVTLRQLLSHRSGLRDYQGYTIPLGDSLKDKLNDPESWYAEAPPGKAPFAYANLGSPLVASVLEAASGERFDRLVERTVFDPLGITGCFNWIGCSPETVARAVVLYRDTGEVARDDPGNLPPNCSIPVAEGTECDFTNYVPGTNASIFSPQGGLRIGMIDLARLGQALASDGEGVLQPGTLKTLMQSAETMIEGQSFFCGYGLGVQMIEGSGSDCVDGLFYDGRARWGHPGEAYGLRSGLWFDPVTGEGFAYFITAVPPRAGAEDEGGFDQREIALMARATELFADAAAQ